MKKWKLLNLKKNRGKETRTKARYLAWKKWAETLMILKNKKAPIRIVPRNTFLSLKIVPIKIAISPRQ
jgi:hypothetical protein